MAKEIFMEFEKGGVVAAVLLEDKAPKTCQAILRALPFQNVAIHAMWAGQEIFFDGFPLSEPLEYENETNDVEPGSVACISTMALRKFAEQKFTSFCVFYGKSRPRKGVDQTVDVNVFAKVRDLEKMTEISKRIRFEGREKMTIRL